MPSKPLYDDPVVAEIRSIREKMLAECGGKPEEFFRRLREGERLQAAAGREFVDGPVATATQASPARSSPPPPAE
jgi:hypothetical protein